MSNGFTDAEIPAFIKSVYSGSSAELYAFKLVIPVKSFPAKQH